MTPIKLMYIIATVLLIEPSCEALGGDQGSSTNGSGDTSKTTGDFTDTAEVHQIIIIPYSSIKRNKGKDMNESTADEANDNEEEICPRSDLFSCINSKSCVWLDGRCYPAYYGAARLPKSLKECWKYLQSSVKFMWNNPPNRFPKLIWQIYIVIATSICTLGFMALIYWATGMCVMCCSRKNVGHIPTDMNHGKLQILTKQGHVVNLGEDHEIEYGTGNSPIIIYPKEANGETSED